MHPFFSFSSPSFSPCLFFFVGPLFFFGLFFFFVLFFFFFRLFFFDLFCCWFHL